MKTTNIIAVLLSLCFALASTSASAAWNVKSNWQDSVSVNGKCYCKTNFDHGLKNKSYRGYKITDICRALGKAPSGGTPYNDIQCGHGPANSAPDEKACPGRVDRGRCEQTKGAKWDWAQVERVLGKNTSSNSSSNKNSNNTQNTNRTKKASQKSSNNKRASNNNDSKNCKARGKNVGNARANRRSARSAFSRQCSGKKIVDCDPVSRKNKHRGSIWECATTRLKY